MTVLINVVSFGYRFGTPTDASVLIDARALYNPIRNPNLRQMSGLDDDVFYAVTQDKRFFKLHAAALKAAVHMVNYSAGQNTISIGVGCTGGRHRSVVLTMELARGLHMAYCLFQKTHKVLVAHRDLEKGLVLQGKFVNARDIGADPKPKKKFNVGQKGYG